MHHSNDLLDYSIIENGSFVSQTTTASLAKSVIDIVNLAKSMLVQKDIVIECDVKQCIQDPSALKFDV